MIIIILGSYALLPEEIDELLNDIELKKNFDSKKYIIILIIL